MATFSYSQILAGIQANTSGDIKAEDIQNFLDGVACEFGSIRDSNILGQPVTDSAWEPIVLEGGDGVVSSSSSGLTIGASSQGIILNEPGDYRLRLFYALDDPSVVGTGSLLSVAIFTGEGDFASTTQWSAPADIVGAGRFDTPGLGALVVDSDITVIDGGPIYVNAMIYGDGVASTVDTETALLTARSYPSVKPLT